MTDDERQSWMQAICEAPADDLPRLVLADRLDEMGDPRGEFIRVQCELAKLPAAFELGFSERNWDKGHWYPVYDPPRQRTWQPMGQPPAQVANIDSDYTALRRREVELLSHDQNNIRWLPTCCAYLYLRDDASQPPNTPTPLWTFTRGFVSHVVSTWEKWARNADAIRRATPLTSVVFTDRPPINATGVDPKEWCEATWKGVTFEMPSPAHELVSNGTRESLELDVILYGSAFIDPQTGERIPPEQVRYTESRGIINARTGHGSAEPFHPPPPVHRRGSPFSRRR